MLERRFVQETMTYIFQMSKSHEDLLQVQYIHEDLPAGPAQTVSRETKLVNSVEYVARVLSTSHRNSNESCCE